MLEVRLYNHEVPLLLSLLREKEEQLLNRTSRHVPVYPELKQIRELRKQFEIEKKKL